MIDKMNPLYFKGVRPIPVIPTVYTDALSYGEQLGIIGHKADECVDKVNEIIEDNQTFKEEVTEQEEQYKSDMQEQYDEFLEDYQRQFGVVQGTGTSTTNVISQKGVTDELAKVVYKPSNSWGLSGQVLESTGDGVIWSDVGAPTDSQVSRAVTDWLNEHPEATTTVEDGSLTKSKFTNLLIEQTENNYLTPEMYGAVGDGVTDDTLAIQTALYNGNVLLRNEYLITDTLFVTGNKNVTITGIVRYTGENEAFRLTGNFNTIDGKGVGSIRGANDNTGIMVTNVTYGGEGVYSDFNVIKNIDVRNFSTAILLWNNGDSGASYFNIINKCTVFNSTVGIEFRGFANGNYLYSTTLYNCGVANDYTKPAVLFKHENTQYPEENMISDVFVTNSTNVACFGVSEKMMYTSFNNCVLEPGGANAKAFNIVSPSNIKNCTFNIITITNLGTGLNNIDKSNLVIMPTLVNAETINHSREVIPTGFTRYYTNSTKYAGNTYIPLMAINFSNYRSVKVSVEVYGNGISVSKLPYDTLKAYLYNSGSGVQLAQSDYFKYEDGTLSIKTPNVFNGGYEYSYDIIKLTVESVMDYSMTINNVWTLI